MRSLNLIFLLLVSIPSPACKLHAMTRNELQQITTDNQDLKNLSRSVNEGLKASHSLLNKIDHATYGLMSAALLGRMSFDQIEPNEWNKARFVGALIYQDQPFSMTALRGTTILIKDAKNKTWDLTTGSHGEFSMPFYELVPYSRLRLFGGVTFESGKKFKQTVKGPVTVEVVSPLCSAKLVLNELDLEPTTLLATP